MTTDAVGGVWQYSTDLAGELARRGHDVALAILGPAPSAAERACAAGIADVRMIETGLPLDWICADPAEVRQAAQGIARLAREWNADLIHCNSPALAGAADFPAPVVAVAHGCIATWWQAAKPEPLDPALRWHGEMMRTGLIAADAVIAPSASFAAMLKATYQLPHLPQVVHNGRPPVTLAAPQTRPLNAAITVGRIWDPVKNGALLDRVAARIDLRFMAAGALRGPHGETADLRHMVALGQVPGAAIGELLARRPIFVSAATFEPFGLAVLEAASAGCALVLSDIPPFRELWDGVAVFADPGDAGSFAAAIMRVADDAPGRRAIGEAARERSSRYRPAATADAVTALYRSLLSACEVAA